MSGWDHGFRPEDVRRVAGAIRHELPLGTEAELTRAAVAAMTEVTAIQDELTKRAEASDGE